MAVQKAGLVRLSCGNRAAFSPKGAQGLSVRERARGAAAWS